LWAFLRGSYNDQRLLAVGWLDVTRYCHCV
jgi:hypothetical protein